MFVVIFSYLLLKFHKNDNDNDGNNDNNNNK